MRAPERPGLAKGRNGKAGFGKYTKKKGRVKRFPVQKISQRGDSKPLEPGPRGPRSRGGPRTSARKGQARSVNRSPRSGRCKTRALALADKASDKAKAEKKQFPPPPPLKKRGRSDGTRDEL